MDYAISTWNFVDESCTLERIIDYSADHGCNTVSLTPAQVLPLHGSSASRLMNQIIARDLSVTVHADFSNAPHEIDRIVDLFGERLACLSFDPRCRIDPAGAFFDPERMVPLLEHARDRGESTGMRFGLEDFPLDVCALDRNRESLRSVLECPRFGALVDLGHMHLRIANIPHFKEKGIEGYISGVPVPIFELHVHDNHGDGDQHMPPGQGSLDFFAAAKALQRIDFQGVSTIEVAPNRYGAQPSDEHESTAAGLQLWRNALEQTDALD